MATGDKLFGMVENWATQYVSKSTFKIILIVVLMLAFIIYQAVHNN
jgi:hypothetical protein